jgi:phage/conjugal plasmid C-4 type zinc finger TraR family protein
MTDLVDQAQEAVALHHDNAVSTGIDAARAKLAGAGREDCRDCGEPIGAHRRAAMPNAVRCTFCQSQLEGAA